jgi:hypothetical protein
MNRDLNDDLSDLLGGETAPATSMKQPPASYAPIEKTVFAEGCPKCRGTGTFYSYSGRALGPCFACKGAGKLEFKTSPEARAKSQQRAAAKKVEAAQALTDACAAFTAANKAEVEWLITAAHRNTTKGGTFTFPQDVLDKLFKFGSLTDGQLAAVRKLMARDAERAAERTAAAPAADVSALDKAFAVARERAERKNQMGVFTKPLLLKSDEVSVSIQPGKPGSKWDGYLFVRDGNNDERKMGFFKDGKFIANRDTTPVEQAAILACATDPYTAVKAYAKAWSRCGVCGQTLLNDVSIEAGMGPVCRGKFGWGV